MPKNKSKKKTGKIIAIILIAVFVISVVFLFFSEESPLNNRVDRPELYIDDANNPECPEYFDCCPGTYYKQKKCPAYQACENFKCFVQECTLECCVLGRYERRECPTGFVCEKFECLLPACPYGCCENESEYRNKFCENNLECRNNECKLRICTSQCCIGKEGYEEKVCSGIQLCVNGRCEKPECPARCCMPNDPDYKPKPCPPHEKCVGRVCTIKFF